VIRQKVQILNGTITRAMSLTWGGDLTQWIHPFILQRRDGVSETQICAGSLAYGAAAPPTIQRGDARSVTVYFDPFPVMRVFGRKSTIFARLCSFCLFTHSCSRFVAI
jgi:hypothetical protein